MPGVIPAEGEAAAPKNIPPPPIIPTPTFMGISIPYLHFSLSNSKSKAAVPIRGNCPMMMFSETPLMGSTSACEAASMRTSTVSSNEHLIRAPLSCLKNKSINFLVKMLTSIQRWFVEYGCLEKLIEM